jgi:thioesterase domain-containing protein/acyl carrier protein
MPYVAPRNPTEHALADIWVAVLGVEPIGLHDNFFELRGDSLLALQLVSRLNEACQVEMPMRSIFETATIAELAETIDALRDSAPVTTEAPPASLIRLQPAGSRPPFFCIHPAGGTGVCYAELARLLGPDQPFYAIQALGVDGTHAPRGSVEAMAQTYIEDIRAVQPQGPYLLGGWSMGGSIAFEMAQRLQAAGQQVGLLVLIDTPAVPGGVAPDALDDLELAASMLGPDIGLEPAALPGQDAGAQLTLLLERAQAAAVLPPHFTPAQFQRIIDMFRTHAVAWWRYCPQRYAGELTLFQAKESLGGPLGTPSGAALGWQALVDRPVEVIGVPGTHQTLIKSPHVVTLAARLRECLDAAAAAWVQPVLECAPVSHRIKARR